MMYGYLAIVIACAAIPLGAVGLLLMMDVIGGSWRENLRPAALRVAGALPWAMLAFVPLGIAALIHPPPAFTPRPEWTGFRVVYLNTVFVVARTCVYAVLWTLLARMAARNAAPRPGPSSAGLVLFVITATLAAVDWMMATDAGFSSSIFGLLFISHAVLAGFAAILVVALLHDPGRPSHGALLLSSLLIWAYMHAMQFLIFWTGDRPDHARWYLMRGEGVWGVLVWLIAAGGLIVPFFVLLAPAHRADPRVLRPLCGTVLAAMALECLWLILPAHGGGWLGVPLGMAVCGGLAVVMRRYAPRARAA